MSVLYFDCFSGAAGDMILGALIDAGVPLPAVREALGSLACWTDASARDGAGREVVWTERVTRAGISATKFCVTGEDGEAQVGEQESGHAHSHGGRVHRHGSGIAQATPHRTIAEIYRLIDGSSLSAAGRDRARELFNQLGEAEAAIHGTPLDQVHLHEVGALDSIIDIVGTVFAMESLGIDRVVSSPLNVGGGTVNSAHGRYPVPAPATLQLLAGVPVYAGPQRAEMVTPTGALLIRNYAQEFGGLPPMRVRTVGYGAGSRDFVDLPNVLRVVIGEDDAASSVADVVVIEAEIDDMNPQIFGVVMDRLLADGALDVFYTAIQMKKNRPGTLMTVIAPPAARQRLTGIIFRETTTIGVRFREMSRECLEREVVAVTTPFGAVRIKLARRDGEILNASPEFDDCARLATETGRPVKDVQAAAMKAFLDSPQQ